MRRGRACGSDGAGGAVQRETAPAGAGKCAIDLFIEDGAYTTLAAAVSILVVLAIAFSAATASWTLSRAGDVQVAADVTALAGANVVSSYHTAATTVDACILSLGLTGLVVTGVGLAGLLIPYVNEVAAEVVDAGIRILKARNKFAESASKGLQTLEESLPYLVALNGVRACSAQDTERASYTGVALAVPRESASDFPALKGDDIATDNLEEAAGDLDAVADELEEAAERSAEAKRRAWLADCGSEGANMRERAGRLSGISAAQNPDYASSITWQPKVAIDRARAYYRWRAAHEVPEGTGVEAQARSAARAAFYRFAVTELEGAYVRESASRVEWRLEDLPRNASEAKRTSLYTETRWPTTVEDGGATLHYGTSCPGAKGAAGPAASLQAIDTGQVRTCPTCKFSIDDVGAAPAASTSIENGFEYHLRAFSRALAEYASARNEELALEKRARKQAERAGDAFEDALSAIAGKRPRIAPPGRDGCVALVVASPLESPGELEEAFGGGASVGVRGAISAAVLAPDKATKENNVLGSFFSTIEERAGNSTVVGFVGSVMDLWGRLLVAYGDMTEGLEGMMSGLFGGLEGLGAGPVASWLGERVRSTVAALGFEPVDLSYRKPVLTDSANVIARSDAASLGDVQEALRSLPIGTTDPTALLQALEYEVGNWIREEEFTIAEIPLPGGGSFPIEVRLGDLWEDS